MVSRRFPRTVLGIEAAAGALLLAAVVGIPLAEMTARLVRRTGLLASGAYLYHAVLWLAFVGGIAATGQGSHLSVTLPAKGLPLWVIRLTGAVSAGLGAFVTAALGVSALSLVSVGFDPAARVGVIPIRIVTAIMPVGFILMSLRFVLRSPRGFLPRAAAALLAVAGLGASLPAVESLYFITGTIPPEPVLEGAILVRTYAPAAAPIVVVVFVASVFIGTPLFVALAGTTYALFLAFSGAVETVAHEAYATLTDPTLPAIPLFAVVGFLLSEGRAGERLVRVFRGLFGRLPGGLAVAAVAVSAFFTTFTGASGVTILALGALLAYILVRAGGYTRRFSRGLVTASGSVGLLLPPSLPIMLYGVVAHVSIRDLFLAGLIPGAMLILALGLLGMVPAARHTKPGAGTRTPSVRPPPSAPEPAATPFLRSLLVAAPELVLPAVVLLAYLLGLATLVETAALAVLYTLLVEGLVHGELRGATLMRVVRRAVPIVGGIFMVLAMARGLAYFVVDAQVPTFLTQWVAEVVKSRAVFLLLLNAGLLIVGCLMDIYSAIAVVVPLIAPLGNLFGVDPVHLGVIFLANLELGYLTPPVGLNLFLASYRFEQPLGRTYAQVLPFFAVLLGTVLLITYVPWLSTWLVSLVGLPP